MLSEYRDYEGIVIENPLVRYVFEQQTVGGTVTNFFLNSIVDQRHGFSIDFKRGPLWIIHGASLHQNPDTIRYEDDIVPILNPYVDEEEGKAARSLGLSPLPNPSSTALGPLRFPTGFQCSHSRFKHRGIWYLRLYWRNITVDVGSHGFDLAEFLVEVLLEDGMSYATFNMQVVPGTTPYDPPPQDFSTPVFYIDRVTFPLLLPKPINNDPGNDKLAFKNSLIPNPGTWLHPPFANFNDNFATDITRDDRRNILAIPLYQKMRYGSPIHESSNDLLMYYNAIAKHGLLMHSTDVNGFIKESFVGGSRWGRLAKAGDDPDLTVVMGHRHVAGVVWPHYDPQQPMPRNSAFSRYGVTVRPLAGDWFDGVKLYRQWLDGLQASDDPRPRQKLWEKRASGDRYNWLHNCRLWLTMEPVLDVCNSILNFDWTDQAWQTWRPSYKVDITRRGCKTDLLEYVRSQLLVALDLEPDQVLLLTWPHPLRLLWDASTDSLWLPHEQKHKSYFIWQGFGRGTFNWPTATQLPFTSDLTAADPDVVMARDFFGNIACFLADLKMQKDGSTIKQMPLLLVGHAWTDDHAGEYCFFDQGRLFLRQGLFGVDSRLFGEQGGGPGWDINGGKKPEETPCLIARHQVMTRIQNPNAPGTVKTYERYKLYRDIIDQFIVNLGHQLNQPQCFPDPNPVKAFYWGYGACSLCYAPFHDHAKLSSVNNSEVRELGQTNYHYRNIIRPLADKGLFDQHVGAALVTEGTGELFLKPWAVIQQHPSHASLMTDPQPVTLSEPSSGPYLRKVFADHGVLQHSERIPLFDAIYHEYACFCINMAGPPPGLYWWQPLSNSVVTGYIWHGTNRTNPQQPTNAEWPKYNNSSALPSDWKARFFENQNTLCYVWAEALVTGAISGLMDQDGAFFLDTQTNPMQFGPVDPAEGTTFADAGTITVTRLNGETESYDYFAIRRYFKDVLRCRDWHYRTREKPIQYPETADYFLRYGQLCRPPTIVNLANPRVLVISTFFDYLAYLTPDLVRDSRNRDQFLNYYTLAGNDYEHLRSLFAQVYERKPVLAGTFKDVTGDYSGVIVGRGILVVTNYTDQPQNAGQATIEDVYETFLDFTHDDEQSSAITWRVVGLAPGPAKPPVPSSTGWTFMLDFRLFPLGPLAIKIFMFEFTRIERSK